MKGSKGAIKPKSAVTIKFRDSVETDTQPRNSGFS